MSLIKLAVYGGIGYLVYLPPVVWDAPGRWPWWYTILWIVADWLAREPLRESP